MNTIEKLIQQLCPEGVEFKKLADIFKISRGRVMSKEFLRDNVGEYPVYSSQTANNGEIGKISTYDYSGEYLTWTTDGANAGTIFYRDEKFSITNVCGLLKAQTNDITPKFAYYVLCIVMKNYVSSGMGNPKLMSNAVEKIPIPIPPLPIQQEIVNILDKFTSLEAELEAELEARKKQYEYYRNELLNFEGKEVEWKTLGEVVNIQRGVRVVRSQLLDCGKYPVYQNSLKPLGYFEKSNCKANTAFIISAGAAGDVGYSDVDFWAADDCFLCICSDHLKSKFLYYSLLCQQTYLYSRVRRASVPRLSRDFMEKILIPIPPLAEQERIVGILDKFDALVNDISVGLPAEVDARRKQYEYYRGKLLDFKAVVSG